MRNSVQFDCTNVFQMLRGGVVYPFGKGREEHCLTYLPFPKCSLPNFNTLSITSEEKMSSTTLTPSEVKKVIEFEGKVEVRTSNVASGGNGCFISLYKKGSSVPIPCSTIVGVYSGVIALYQPHLQYAIGLQGVSDLGQSFCVDAEHEGNEFRFANYHHHSNAEFIEVHVKGFVGGIICVRTTREVKVGEEVFLNYESNYTTLKEKNASELCKCGASFCTGFLGFRGGSPFSRIYLQETSSMKRVEEGGRKFESHLSLTTLDSLPKPPSPFIRGNWFSTLRSVYNKTHEEFFSAKEYFFFDPIYTKTIHSLDPTQTIPSLLLDFSIPIVCLIGFFQLSETKKFIAFQPLVYKDNSPLHLSSPNDPPKILNCVTEAVFLLPLCGQWLPLLDQVWTHFLKISLFFYIFLISFFFCRFLLGKIVPRQHNNFSSSELPLFLVPEWLLCAFKSLQNVKEFITNLVQVREWTYWLSWSLFLDLPTTITEEEEHRHITLTPFKEIYHIIKE